MLWLHLDAGRAGNFPFIEICAIADPLQQRLIERAVLFHQTAAGVWDRAGGLGEHQRFFRQRQVDPAAGHFGGEPEVVAFRIEAEERKVEAILPPRGAVAGAGVAAGSGEDRHHVELEGNRPGLFRVFDGHGHLGAEPAVVDPQTGGTVLFRGERCADQMGKRDIGEC